MSITPPTTFSSPSAYVFASHPLSFAARLQPLKPPVTDAFYPRFAGKRLQKAKSNFGRLFVVGALLGVGTIANAAFNTDDTPPPAYQNQQPGVPRPGSSTGNASVFKTSLDQIAEYSRQSAQLYVPPASGRVANDVVLRQTFCEYLTNVSKAISQYNGSGLYLTSANIPDCYPETVFDPTDFSRLMNKVYEEDGWHAVEKNYDAALKIVFGESATQISAHDKKVLLNEAEKAFNALDASQPDSHGKSGKSRAGDENIIDKTWDNIHKSKIMLALLMASAVLLGVGFSGRVVFGTANRIDNGVQAVRQKRRTKKALKNVRKD